MTTTRKSGRVSDRFDSLVRCPECGSKMTVELLHQHGDVSKETKCNSCDYIELPKGKDETQDG